MVSSTSIRATLEAQGFKRTQDPYSYRGKLQCGHKEISVTVRVADNWFLTPPEVFIDDPEELPNEATPHLEEGNRLCYSHPGTLRLDPYDTGRSILAVLEKAKTALQDSFISRATEAFAREYTAYWRSEFRFQFIEEAPDGVSSWELYSQDHPDLLQRKRQTRGNRTALVIVVQSNNYLKPKGSLLRPKNVRELSEWWDYNQLNTILPFKEVKTKLQNGTWVFAKGLNAALGVRLTRSAPIKGRHSSELIPKRFLLESELSYAVGQNASATFIAQRCIGSENSTIAPLAGIEIALIGCGTIGSQLAPLLARSGAGAGNGKLILVDPESLTAANLGRHTGGLLNVGRMKADVVAQQVGGIHPFLNVDAHTKRVEDIWPRLRKAKLLIDATGIENLSDWINFKHLEEKLFRPVIYSWIVQEGAAVQAFTARYGEEDACYRCLRPELDSIWRSSPLKKPDRDVKFIYGSCGDGAYVPFSVGTSVCAASLALEAAINAISRKSSINLMTRVTNFELAKIGENKNQRLSKSNECPACRE